MSSRTPHKAYLLNLLVAITGAVLFSAKTVVVKLLYRYNVDPVTIIGFRMMMSLPFFVAIAVWKTVGQKHLHKHDYARIVFLGLIGYYLASLLDFMGLQYISAGLGRLIAFMAPTFVLLISAIFLKKKISRMQWLALLAAYAGIVLVFIHDTNIGGPHVMLGCAYVLGSALSYSFYLLLSEKLVKRIGPLRLVAYTMCVSSTAVITHYFTKHSLSDITHQAPEVYYLSLINAIFCTVMPVCLTMIAISRIGADVASQATMIGPVSTLLLGAWLLDEPITPIQIVGTAFVLTGIYFLSKKNASLDNP